MPHHFATTIAAFLGMSISEYGSKSGYCSTTLDRMLRCCGDLTLLLVLTCSSTLKRLNIVDRLRNGIYSYANRVTLSLFFL